MIYLSFDSRKKKPNFERQAPSHHLRKLVLIFGEEKFSNYLLVLTFRSRFFSFFFTIHLIVISGLNFSSILLTSFRPSLLFDFHLSERKVSEIPSHITNIYI